MDYKRAGVDIEAGNRAVEMIKRTVRSTFRPEVLTEIGGFGGLFSFPSQSYEQPVLVSATDGVGTKLEIAKRAGRHETVGIDLVAMCANDVLVSGAEPLFFLDYIAIGRLVPEKVAKIVEGVAEGCRQAGCALLGGETAEHPGVMEPDEYDLAGFCVGVVERHAIVDGTGIAPGDVVLGLSSKGLHSNGYSLVRKILAEAGIEDLSQRMGELQCTWGEELLRPTRIYVKSILALLKAIGVKGAAHITGGGIVENVGRVLPEGTQARIDTASWPKDPVFALLQGMGDVPEEEMYRTFNMGIGFVVIVAEGEVDEAARVLREHGEHVHRIGEIAAGEAGGVVLQRQ
ncbi:MAG: phosphoribosylformylglycinamidine cyclo-ligase [Actinobacteria bacterium]|nr:MAG: phosphoribosylformylglycinamidine cyclo-ligase [Actinomycetota bacterium]